MLYAAVCRMYLHLAVDHPSIHPLPIDVVHLGAVVLLSQGGIEDMVQVDWQYVKEAAGSCSVHRVAGPESFEFIFRNAQERYLDILI